MHKFKTSTYAGVNKEWWVLLSLFVISALLTSVGGVNQMLLFLYVLPTLASAYLFGRRHATLTAMASVFLVVGGTFVRDALFQQEMDITAMAWHWWEIAVWGAILVLTAYATGTMFRETHDAYDGLVLMLRNMMVNDATTQDSVRRLAMYATAIAEEMPLTREQVDFVRTTALVHDISKLDINPDVLRKVLRLAANSPQAISDAPMRMLQKVLPILIARMEGGKSEMMPVEAKIIAVAEEFDSTISAGERRSALPASVARNVIERASGVKFDADVVAAFLRAYDSGKLMPRVNAPDAEETQALVIN